MFDDIFSSFSQNLRYQGLVKIYKNDNSQKYVPEKSAKNQYWKLDYVKIYLLEGACSGVRQFLANESPLKAMKTAFYFTWKALFVLKIFKLLTWLFGHVAKRLD